MNLVRDYTNFSGAPAGAQACVDAAFDYLLSIVDFSFSTAKITYYVSWGAPTLGPFAGTPEDTLLGSHYSTGVLSYATLRGYLTQNASNNSVMAAAQASLPATSSTWSGGTFLAPDPYQSIMTNDQFGSCCTIFNHTQTFDWTTSFSHTPTVFPAYSLFFHEETEPLCGRRSDMDTALQYDIMDLYCYSGSGTRNISNTAGARTGTAYASPDGGVTNLGTFNNTGPGDFGDWSGEGITATSPFLAFTGGGTALIPTQQDIQLLTMPGLPLTTAGKTAAGINTPSGVFSPFLLHR